MNIYLFLFKYSYYTHLNLPIPPLPIRWFQHSPAVERWWINNATCPDICVNKLRSSEWQNSLFSISVSGAYLGKSKRRQRSQVKGSILLSLLYIFKRQEYFLFNRSYVVYRDLYLYRQRVLVITVVKFWPLWWRILVIDDNSDCAEPHTTFRFYK